MIRRQNLLNNNCYQDKCFNTQISFRKARTVGAGSNFQDSILYQDKFEFEINDWIGKIMIPWNGENMESFIRKKKLGLINPEIISEFEIANHLKPHIYRILYAVELPNGKLQIKSKPQIDYVPSRANLILTTDNRIQAIVYF